MRPADALRTHIEKGSTGSLTVRLGAGLHVSVYLLQGEILAAESQNDGAELVRRLVNAGYLSVDQGQACVARLEHSGQVGEVLFGTVADDVVMELYGRRFRQNLAEFLLADGDTSFEAKEDIHVENVQVGHDSYELLEQMDALLGVAEPLMPPGDVPRLLPGSEAPATRRQEQLLDLLPSDGSLVKLLWVSPYETVETLAEVAEALLQGCLALDGPAVRYGGAEAAMDAEEVTAEDCGTFMAEPVVDDDQPMFDEPVVVEDMALFDEPAVAEDTLAMFADHDHSRGRGGDGVFTVSRDLLDTVDLSGVDLLAGADATEEELVLEMEDGDEVEAAGGAVSLRFGSPPLTHEEAITKIEVTNEVLRQLAKAMDEEHGSGSGQASVQLLVESARTDLAPLFSGVSVARDGALNVERMIRNIDKRPETERRRTLNRAMRDIIERGFTTAVERISDERFEALLEDIAGYQHRLGL
jgi:hypothetical protein